MVIDTNAGGVGKNRLNAPNHTGNKVTPPISDASNSGASSRTTAPNDSVSLSGAAKAMGRLESKIAQGPEVNSAKVEELKLSINNGTYSPNPSAIADKMLSDF